MHGSQNPLVSIVTVCRNSQATIGRTIASVLGQTWPHLEYVIIDGASTDGTPALIADAARAAGDRVRWVSEPDGGVFAAMNKGLAQTRGELVGILNSDDWYEPDTVETVVEAHRRDGSISVFHGDILYWSGDHHRADLIRPMRDVARIRRAMSVHHAACFVTRSAYAACGWMDTRFRLAADYDLMLRFHLAGHRFQYIPRVLANMTEGGLSERHLLAAFGEVRRIKVERGLSPLLAGRHYVADVGWWAAKRTLERVGLRALIRLHRRLVAGWRNPARGRS